MKFLPIVFALTLATSFVPFAEAAENVQQLLTDAQTAYMRGDMETAKSGFEMVYRLDPRNTVAIAYLRRIKLAEEAARAKGGGQEVQLSTLMIPKVEYRDATLREALEALRKKVTELSDGKLAVNFVLPPGDPTDSTRVTLSLQNIPFPEAVRYIGRVANFEFTFEKYAIVGKPAKSPQ